MLTDGMSDADSDATTMQFSESVPPAAAAAVTAVAQRNPAASLSWRTEPTAVRGSTTATAPAVPPSGTADMVDEFSFDAPTPATQQSAQPLRARSHGVSAASSGITLQSAVDAARAAAAAVNTASRKRPAATPSTAASTAAAAAAASQPAGDRKRSRISILPPPAAAAAAAAASQKSGDRKRRRISIQPAAAAVPAAMTTAASATASSKRATGNAGAAAAAAAAVASQQNTGKHSIAAAGSIGASSVKDYMRGANAELMANEGVSRAFAKLLFDCHSAVEDVYSVSHGGQSDSATAAAAAAAVAAAVAMVAESRDRTIVHKAAEQDYLHNASNHLLAAENTTVACRHSLNNCYWAIMKQL
jgi:trimeric autotransporter adhesin